MSIHSICAPTYISGMFVAVQVITGAKTLSPGLIPAKIKAKCKAEVAELVEMFDKYDVFPYPDYEEGIDDEEDDYYDGFDEEEDY